MIIHNLASYSKENGGRVLLLFLLFSLAIFQFITSGYNAFVTICFIPFIIPLIYAAFKWKMFCFWLLTIINYFIQCLNKNELLPGGIPLSMYNELIEIILLGIAIIDFRETPHFERIGNLMLLSISVWCVFCTLEAFNNTCNLGINLGAWYTGARLLAFQLLYAFLVFTLYITNSERLIKYIRLWACLALFSVFWTWKQLYIEPTRAEYAWLWNVGASTHVLNAGTLIRWFSTFNDAASYGINAAATAVFFYIMSITSRIKFDRIFFIITAILITWGMFQSGTRTAIYCLIAGFIVFLVLSRNFRIIVPSAIGFALLLFILIFTNIGNSNQQIRRMRSGFNKKDASANVRAVNQEVMKKYIRDAPWGIGIGMGYDNVPSNNKYYKLATIPPDSEYVYIWLRTGPIGLSVFLFTTIAMFLGACYVVFFKISSRSLMGVGAGLCGSFVAIQLGGYGNQILMQFPNCLLFYGGLSIVYTLPYLEPTWVKIENRRLDEQEERKRQKLEKKLAKRV